MTEFRKCPCWERATCKAYQRLYPVDPICVRGLEENEHPNKFTIDELELIFKKEAGDD